MMILMALVSLAMSAIVGSAQDPAQAQTGDWPMLGGSPDRNMVSGETGISAKWDLKKKENVKWVVKLGSPTYGAPVIAGGRIFIGTNNKAKLRKGINGDKGVMACLDESTGRFLWQATHDKLPSGQVNDWPEQGIPSAPWVDDDRLYYVSNRCELVCADVDGFLDGKNDGPFQNEKHADKQDADFIWILDMFEDLKVFPHNLATCSPVGAGDMIFVSTSNGVDESHKKVPSPEAPSLIAVNKKTGKVLWRRADPGKNILHGQWGSPAYGVIKGRPLVIFGAGDGWCYAHDAKTGEVVWKFDLNPKESKWGGSGRGDRNSIVATPVIQDDKVFLCVGQDPENGTGIGHLYCIDATKTGDVTETGRVWHHGGEAFNRSMSMVAVADGLLYAADIYGMLHCLNAKTGKPHWTHDTFAAIWGSPYVVDGKVMIGTTDGEVLVFTHGKDKELLATNDMQNTVYGTPVASNGVLYVGSCQSLVAIVDQKAATSQKAAADQDNSRQRRPRAPELARGVRSHPLQGNPPKERPARDEPARWIGGSSSVAGITLRCTDTPATSQKASTEKADADKALPASKATSQPARQIRDWPMFRGNPQLTGVAACDLPNRPVVLWKQQAGETVTSSAAIVGGEVFVGSEDGIVLALDLDTGAVKWRYRTTWTSDDPKGATQPAAPEDEPGPAVRASPCVYGDTVFFGDEDGVFHAVEKASGRVRWTFRAGGEIISSANCVGDRILFGAYDGCLYCLSPDSGKLLWKYKTEGPVHGTPAVAGDRVVVAGCDARFHIVRLRDGAPMVQVDAGDRSAASPAVRGETVFIATLGSSVMALDVVSGKTLWTYAPKDRSLPFHGSAAVNDRYVIVGGRDKRVHALDPKNGAIRWTFKTKGGVDSSPVMVGDRVFFGSSDGHLYALELETGRKVWQFETGAPISASPAISADHLVIGSEDGVVYCFGKKR